MRSRWLFDMLTKCTFFVQGMWTGMWQFLWNWFPLLQITMTLLAYVYRWIVIRKDFSTVMVSASVSYPVVSKRDNLQHILAPNNDGWLWYKNRAPNYRITFLSNNTFLLHLGNVVRCYKKIVTMFLHSTAHIKFHRRYP